MKDYKAVNTNSLIWHETISLGNMNILVMFTIILGQVLVVPYILASVSLRLAGFSYFMMFSVCMQVNK